MDKDGGSAGGERGTESVDISLVVVCRTSGVIDVRFEG